MTSTQSTPLPVTNNLHFFPPQDLSCRQQKRSNIATSCPELAAAPTRRRDRMHIQLNEAVSQVPVQFFVGEHGILPSLPPDSGITLEDVIETLKQKELIRDHSSSTQRRWAYFAKDASSSAYNDVDDAVFRGIDENMFEAIEDAANTKRKPLLKFKCNPHMPSNPSTRNVDSRPDCYGLLVEGPTGAFSQKPHWTSVGVPGEFKESASNEIDNWSKILWSIDCVMQQDPRRRFVFAFTIEGTNMRMWVASRNEVLASLPFNFIERYEHTIEFFLRLMYAEQEQIGWDTTMVPVETKGCVEPVQYIIECAGTNYKTVDLISDFGAEVLRGRGTRVWEVREIKSNGEVDSKPLVLKDSWVDCTRRREGEILEKVRDDAIRTGTLDGFERHFMKVRAYGDVPLSELPETPFGRKRRKYGWKIHHRTVYEEIGATIDEMDTLSGALSALCDAVKGLEVLHRCGWVHRDISIGNVLVVNGVGKLTDLEYAKRESDSQIDEGRTGTPDFISTEVELQIYLHRPLSTSYQALLVAARKAKRLRLIAQLSNGNCRNPTAPNDLLVITPRGSSNTCPEAQPPYDPEDFRYNPLHDLESAMWLGARLLIGSKFVFNPASGMSNEDWTTYLQGHANCAQSFFGYEPCRRMIMTASDVFATGFVSLLPQVFDIGMELDDWRIKLLKQYIVACEERQSSKSPPPFATMAGTLHADMISLLLEAVEEFRKPENDLKIKTESRIQECVKKRERTLTLVLSSACTHRPSESAQDKVDRPNKRLKRYHEGAAESEPGAVVAGSSTDT